MRRRARAPSPCVRGGVPGQGLPRPPPLARPPARRSACGPCTSHPSLPSPRSASGREQDGGERGRDPQHARGVREQVLRVQWGAAAALLPGEDGGDRQFPGEGQRRLDCHLPQIR